ncbi:ROK family protein [Staphylococcus gallinarum]|jgi:glucokinase|uniref:Glucokinase n=1 Tax=Staphylococcus gallinarum TaxID=1293 RepID=A0ABQ0Y3S2_STAGA|nr:ROK family protein [Staphylococcus gallinarum]KIR10141.1 transcriptional regulator [Staphylococcus gallinarum]MCD8901168.1 ROK family protein [Staphylococcus gallinarum]MCD8902568.1 ROK family protein [Staphylococcus gallinarum]MCD8911211.1 ROK family protein [Staphylococcus gallinarum]MCD8921458.1 ROK family protein [Staphylococcus gallinarum]
MLKLCVDIGGTKTIVGVVNEQLDIIASKKFETIKEDPKQQFTEIIKLANHFVTEYKEVDSNILNIAMPGPCDYTQGLFLNPPNLQQYNQFNAGQYIEQHSQFKPSFVNDTDAAALAEYRYIKSTTSDFVYLTISTGVGMAYVKNGQLVSGVDGNFGEIGHTVIKNDSDYQCPVCHQYGCVENEISGLAISRKASDLLNRPVTTREAITMYLEHEDETIHTMVEEVIKLTQQLCINIFSVFNIYHIVLGGGVTQSALPYKEAITNYVSQHHLIQNSTIQIDISHLEANVLTGLYFIN